MTPAQKVPRMGKVLHQVPAGLLGLELPPRLALLLWLGATAAGGSAWRGDVGM